MEIWAFKRHYAAVFEALCAAFRYMYHVGHPGLLEQHEELRRSFREAFMYELESIADPNTLGQTVNAVV